MKENLKIGLEISGKTALKWIFIVVFGLSFTGIALLIAFFDNAQFGGSYHGSLIALVFVLLRTNVFAFIIIFGTPVFFTLYYIVANKISIQTAIYLLWKRKAGAYISSKVGDLTKKFTNQEEKRNTPFDQTEIKSKLLKLIKTDANTSKLQRKVIKFGLKRIRLDEIDFQDENLNLSDILKEKFNTLITETIKPSFKLFWILFLIHLLLLIASLVFPIPLIYRSS